MGDVTILIMSWKQNQVSFSYVYYHNIPAPSEEWVLDPNVFSLHSLWGWTVCFPEDINAPQVYCFAHRGIHPNKTGKARLCSLSSRLPSPGEACGQPPVAYVNFAYSLSHSPSSHSVQGLETDHENTQEIHTPRWCVSTSVSGVGAVFLVPCLMCHVVAMARGAFLVGFNVPSCVLLSYFFLTGDLTTNPCTNPSKELSKWSAKRSPLCPTLHQEPIPGGNK